MPTPSTPEIPRISSESTRKSEVYWPCAGKLVFLIAAYFILQVIVRVTCSTSTDLDESEAVILAQKLGAGYGSAPPLYTWLQISIFAILGKSVLGLSVLKNLLLFSTYMLTFAAARLLTKWEPAAVAAALSVFYLPSVAWESQRDLTHSVMAATCALGTLYCFLQVLEKRKWLWYLLLGICGGCGVISKYNYALWLVGLTAAGLSMRRYRDALLDWKGLAAAGLVVLIILPNMLWILQHRDIAFLTTRKLQIDEQLSLGRALRLGLKNVFQSLTAFTGPLTLIYLLIFLKAPKDKLVRPTPEYGYRTLLMRAWLIVGVLVVSLIVFARASGLKERWFQPILVALPILGISLSQIHLTPLRLRFLFGITVTVMIAVSVIMPGRLFAAESLHREEPLTRPYARLAAEISSTIPKGSLVLCDTGLLAGNLKLRIPQATVITPELRPLFRGRYEHIYMAWDARKAFPDNLKRVVDEIEKPGPVLRSEPALYSAVYRHHTTKLFTIAVQQIL